MLDGLIGGLIIAWILSLFGVDEMVIEVIQPFTQAKITASHYYVLMAIIGLVNGLAVAKNN